MVVKMEVLVEVIFGGGSNGEDGSGLSGGGVFW